VLGLDAQDHVVRPGGDIHGIFGHGHARGRGKLCQFGRVEVAADQIHLAKGGQSLDDGRAHVARADEADDGGHQPTISRPEKK
jgi:hypothetical protein